MEIRSDSRPYVRARGEVASGIGIFLSRDSVGASSYLGSPNGIGPWSYANLNPARYTDPDGRDVGFAGCLALEKSGKGDVGTCMRGLITPNRKRSAKAVEADAPEEVSVGRGLLEGVGLRIGGMVMDPAELAINSIGFDPDFNRISAGQQERAKKEVDELQGAAVRRAWFPPLLIKDALVTAGTSSAEFASNATDCANGKCDTRALGGSGFEAGLSLYGVFEGGVGAGRFLNETSQIPSFLKAPVQDFATELSETKAGLGLQTKPGLTGPPTSPRQYSVAFETQLDPSLWARIDDVHFRRANAALDDALAADPAYRKVMEEMIPGVSDAVSSVGGRDTPTGWTWQHATRDQGATWVNGARTPRSGLLQLVPSEATPAFPAGGQHIAGSSWWRLLHPLPGAGGGYFEWARPAGAPPR